MSLPLVPRRLLRDQAYDVLLAAILSGRLEPGAVIRDGELAAETGLSRTPVREALSRLADEGLVESKPNAYTRVTELDRTACLEAHAVVQCLHESAARTAAGRVTSDHLVRLRAANLRFAAALDAGDVDGVLAADDDLHDLVLEAAGNRTLRQAIERLMPRVRRLERLRFSTGPGRDSVAMHARIIDALAAGDPDAAARATAENFATLGRLIDEAFADPAAADPAATARPSTARARRRPARTTQHPTSQHPTRHRP